jgi:hypothetical protein
MVLNDDPIINTLSKSLYSRNISSDNLLLIFAPMNAIVSFIQINARNIYFIVF